MVFEDGETLTLIVGAVPLKGTAPGDNVPLMVPEPVTDTLMEELPPSQMVAEPLIDAVGRSFTVKVAWFELELPLILVITARYL